MVRLYDVLLGHAKELAEVGRQVGGAAGEALLDECAAKVSHGQHVLKQAVRCSEQRLGRN